MPYTIDIDGLDRLELALRLAPARLVEHEIRAMADSVDIVQDAVRRRTPIVTGRLEASIQSMINPRLQELEGRIFTRLEYAPWVEGGRGAIRARSGHALGPMRGIGFRRSVGPAAGRFMFREGLRASIDQVKDRFRDMARAVAREIAGK